ncbi:MAG: TRAP transporter substrate-binding protein DctP [Arenicella sp.]
MIKKIITLSIMLTAPISALHAQTTSPKIIRFVHTGLDSSPIGQVAKNFKQAVYNEIGENEVVVKIINDYPKANSGRSLDILLNGQVEIMAIPFSAIKNYDPRFQVLNLPFIFSSLKSANSFIDGVYGERLMLSLDPKGLFVFGHMNTGMKHLFTKEKIVSPEKMQELNISTSASFIEQRWVDRLGAYSISEKFNESIFLNDELLDGYSESYANFINIDATNSKGYILETGHMYSGFLILAAKTFWDTLSNELKTVLTDTMTKSIQQGNEIVEELTKLNREKLIASNNFEITKLSIESRQNWVNASSSVWMLWNNEIGDLLIKEAASQR